jgi:hypothetical protein
MRRQNVIVMLLGEAIVGGLTWYLVSPTYAMSKLREAALAGDIAQLEQRVDFPAFKESAKIEFRAQLTAELEKEKDTRNSLAALGGALAIGLIDPLIDKLITPEGIKAMIAHGRLDSKGSRRSQSGQAPTKWNIERQGISRFLARSGDSRDDAAPALVFERDGFGWKLVGISFGQAQSADTEEQID